MLMRLCAFGAVLVTVMEVGPARADDKVVGAIWEINWVNPNKGEDRVYHLRATPDGKVWNMPSKSVPHVIGKWSGNVEKSEMTIDGIRAPLNKPFNGSYIFVLFGKDPPSWRGTMTDADGKPRPIKVKLIKD